MSRFQTILATVVAFVAIIGGGGVFGILTAVGVIGGDKPVPEIHSIKGSLVDAASPPEVMPNQDVDVLGKNLDLVSGILLSKGVASPVPVFLMPATKTRLIMSVPSSVQPGDYNLEFKTKEGDTVVTVRTLVVSAPTTTAASTAIPTPIPMATSALAPIPTSTSILTLIPMSTSTLTPIPTPAPIPAVGPPPTVLPTPLPLTVATRPTFHGWHFDTEVGPTADELVQKAIVDAINEAEFGSNFFFWPNWPSPDGAVRSYDPIRAKELLSEAGFPDGFGNLCIDPAGSAAIEIAIAMASMLADFGMKNGASCGAGRLQITLHPPP